MTGTIAFGSIAGTGCGGLVDMRLQAVIFDFDGIIVDSEPVHHEAFVRVLEKHGLPFSWEHYYEHYLGFDDRDVFRTRYKDAGLALSDAHLRELMEEKARVFVDIIHAGGVKPYPGVVELIRSLHASVPLAICSGALLSDIQPILDQLNLQDCFPVRVTADQVDVSKPDPESYRESFARLKNYSSRVTDPARCVAIEDTPAGIAAARGADLRVLAVTNTYEAGELAGADKVVDSLARVDATVLDALVS